VRGPGLAATDDPRELIPGSLTALYDDAADLRLHARGLEKASAEVTRNDVPSWLGDAAARWGDRRPVLAAQLDVPVEVYRVCADALEAHARVIELARELVEVAIALWERGATAVSFAGSMCEPLGVGLGGSGLGAPWTSALGRSLRQQAAAARAQVVVPPAAAGGGGAELCAQAERILAALRAMVDRSASALAELLDACCLDMPDGRFHLGSYFAGLGDWLYGIGELCVRFSTPRLILDGDAYIADGAAMIDGWRALAEHLAGNPHDANRLLLDSETFRDDPGRWIGRLAPDVALTVLGVPAVGKAAKLATLGRGARILDDLEDVEDLLGDGRTLDDVAESADGSGAEAATRLLERVERAEEHLRRLDPSPANDAMLERLRSAALEGRPLHESEEAFLRHELTEAEYMDAGLSYDEAHALAGATHPTFGNYHPEVIADHPEMFSRRWFDYWGLER